MGVGGVMLSLVVIEVEVFIEFKECSSVITKNYEVGLTSIKN